MNHEIFISLTVRIEIAEVLCVAMAEAGRPQQSAVVINGCRAIDNLVTAVAVYIAGADVVSSLSVGSITVVNIKGILVICIRGLAESAVVDFHILFRHRGVQPFRREMLAVEVNGPQI